MAKRNYKRKLKRYPSKKHGLRATRYSLTTYAPKFQSGVPAQQRVKLIYAAEGGSLGISLGTPFPSVVWNMNNIFQVTQFSGINNQPRAFDQYIQMYNRYRITSVKITTECYNITNSGVAQIFLIPLAYNTPIMTSSKQALEYGKVTHKTCTFYEPVKFTRTLSISQVEGVSTKLVETSNDYSAGIGEGPPRTTRMQLAAGTLKIGDSSSIIYRTYITFYGIFYQPHLLAAS